MAEIRDQIGANTPVYLSFDIDSIDPSACPGTGTPEIGGLTTAQALEVVRGCKGLNLVSLLYFVGIHGNPWESLGIRGNPWESAGIHGNP